VHADVAWVPIAACGIWRIQTEAVLFVVRNRIYRSLFNPQRDSFVWVDCSLLCSPQGRGSAYRNSMIGIDESGLDIFRGEPF
jgi:hypothetical protein